MENRKAILLRTYLIYAVMCIVGAIIVVRLVMIQYTHGSKWKQEQEQMTTAFCTINAVRGNIYDEDGRLIATSLPFYDVAMDVNTDYLTEEIFNSGADSLSLSLASLFPDKSYNDFYRILWNARKAGERYVLLEKAISYDQLQNVKKFPLFRLGKNKGGLIITQTTKRELPFRDLAERTIGYARENIKPVGLEGAFNEYLKGIDGQGLMEKTVGGVWVPVNDEDDLQPQNGEDIISTININYQDVAESALRDQLIKHHADHGCVVLMEVKTGRVLAIANLARKDSTGRYEEDYNYAIGEETEPGSTFKLASLIVAMEDGYVNPQRDSVNLQNGEVNYYDRTLKDADHDEHGWVSVQRAFEISSNVGISKTIYKYYANQPKKFVDGLCRLGLAKPLHLIIPGEGTPKMPNPSDKEWSGTSLPWLSIGYGLTVTPLQTLTLYNAVANNGVMVKPQFVDALVKDGKIVARFQPQVINPSICSSGTISKVKKLLEGVVLHGTASNLKNSVYPIAGKTGTAQIAKKGQYKNGADVNYQASFTGYFPADNPEYSCIVVVNSPSADGYYGNVAAGPIFREIADKVYASSVNIDPVIHKEELNDESEPLVKKGNCGDTYRVLNELSFAFSKGNTGTGLVQGEWKNQKWQYSPYNARKVLGEGIMPDLHGMDLQDAIFLLDNSRLKVNVKGCGAVSDQSIPAGTKFQKGQTISLTLS